MEPTSTVLTRSSEEKTLNLLSPAVRAAFEKRDFGTLSEAQVGAIPHILEGNNLLLIAPTGTGKTESAMLPVFDRLLESGNSGGFSALYITPLRSLNRDILSRLTWWCGELGLKVGVRHGDTTASERRRQALNPPSLLITTPETLQALFLGHRLREHLKQVKYVIIDEIHELASSKRGAQLSVALERLTLYAGDFQRIGLSATIGNPAEVARFLCGDRPCGVVKVPVSSRLDISVISVSEDPKSQTAVIEGLMENEHSTLLFVNTRAAAESLGQRLYERGDVEVHHGSLSREVRVEAEDRFRDGELKTLVCTSSMELGIDIGHIGHVLQFGSPRQVSRLVQRAGRAGHRLHTISRATVLATDYDDLLESAVIAGRASRGECEDIVLPDSPADVLANQIAALAVEYGTIPLKEAAEIVCRSACYAGAGDLVERVCLQMEKHRLIRIEEDVIVRTGRSRKYLYSNLSMISDERKIRIFDITARRSVGTLDESFLVSWVHTGAIFVTKGQLWQVVDIEEERIMVEPARQARGELPTWEGEQIPVPLEIAREVGRLRRTGCYSGYPINGGAVARAEEFRDGMERAGQEMPSDRLITIERFDEGVILNICAGHRVNEALSRAISVMLSARFGTTVGIETDAYHIVFRLPPEVTPNDVRYAFLSLRPGHVREILRIALKRTSLYKWKLVQVAKKFGAIDQDAEYERFSMNRLYDLFEGTVIQEEVMREILADLMDTDGADGIIAAIAEGEIEVAYGPLSPVGLSALSSSRDMMPPLSADQAVCASVKRRLLEEKITLFCMHCRRWKSRTIVSRVPDTPRCPLCGAGLIAAVKPYEEDLISAAQKKKRNAEEEKHVLRINRNANIVLSSGKKAVIAFASRGVGPETASRILASMREGDDFYREILNAERRYIRTHRFWSDR